MESKRVRSIAYKSLLGMIPFVMDFLDIDFEDVIAYGLLDDDSIDDAIISLIMGHEKKTPSCSSVRSEAKANDHHHGHGDGHGETTSTALVQMKTANPDFQLTMLNNTHTDSFRECFRMSNTMFEMLLNDTMTLTSFAKRKEGESSNEGQSSLPFVPATMLMLTLRFIGCQQSMEELAGVASISENKLSCVVQETMQALYELMPHYIRWPEKDDVVETSEYFKQKCCLPGVLGVIDVLHIHVKPQEEHADYYINQQRETTVMLQTVLDHKSRFLHCCTGWPGSMDEMSVLKNSDLCTDAEDQIRKYFPFDSYLIGDNAYNLSQWLMTSFQNPDNLNPFQLKFNKACKMIMEYSTLTYRLLMQRFPRLEFVKLKDMQNMVVTILVCCALHNFCLENGDMDLFEDTEVIIRNINTVAKPTGTNDTESQIGEEKRKYLLETLQSLS